MAESVDKTLDARPKLEGRRSSEGNYHRNKGGRRTQQKPSQSRASNKKRGGEGDSLLSSLRELVQTNLDDSTFVVFDIETTGGNPERNGITEIAALKIVEGKIVDRYYTLVNPMIPIPPIVRRMTGITNQLVKDAPVIDEVYPDFADFIEDHILVSHNTIGDLIFLRHFARDTIGRDLRNFFLCTHLLVEKLASEAPDKSLKGLSKFFSLAGAEFHRAEADAIQTWELFKILLKRLKERGVSKVEHAIRLQGDLDSSLRLGWSISRDKMNGLPQSTGVFYLYDHERRLIFLSSASNLAREVAKLEQHDLIPRQILKLALRSYDLQSTRMPSVFSAMLAECDGREKHSIQVDPVTFHQRQVQVIGIYEDKNEGQRLAVGPIETNLRFAFGPVRDRKRAIEFVEELADILGEKVTRSGMLISPDHRQLILNLMSGSLLDYQRKIEKSIFGLRLLFWKREVLKRQRLLLDRIASLVFLEEARTPPWKSVADLNGIIVTPDEVAHAWQVYSIAGGIPRSMHQVRGEWQVKLCQGGVGKRIYSKLDKDIRANRAAKSLSQSDLGRMNAVLWWLQYGKSKDRGCYLDFSEFAELLSVRRTKRARAKSSESADGVLNEGGL